MSQENGRVLGQQGQFKSGLVGYGKVFEFCSEYNGRSVEGSSQRSHVDSFMF